MKGLKFYPTSKLTSEPAMDAGGRHKTHWSEKEKEAYHSQQQQQLENQDLCWFPKPQLPGKKEDHTMLAQTMGYITGKEPQAQEP